MSTTPADLRTAPPTERRRAVEWIDALPAVFRSEAFAEDLGDEASDQQTWAFEAPGQRAAAFRLPAVHGLLAITLSLFRPAIRA